MKKEHNYIYLLILSSLVISCSDENNSNLSSKQKQEINKLQDEVVIVRKKITEEPETLQNKEEIENVLQNTPKITKKPLPISTYKEEETLIVKSTAKVPKIKKEKIITDTVKTSASAVISTTSIDQKGISQSTKPWTLATSLGAATSVKETDAASDYINSNITSSLTYKINDKFTAQALVAASKQLKDEYAQSVDAAFIGINAKLFNYKDTVQGSAKLRTYFPVNQDSREDQSFRGRIYTNLGLSVNLADIGLNSVTISTGLTAAKNIHEFEYTNTGSDNTNYYSTGSLAISWATTEKLILSLGASTTTSWNYDNETKGPSTYSLSQSLSYSLAKRWSLDFSHEIGGSAYGYNGSDLEIEVFDKDSSSVSSSLTFVY